jgi:ATP synthase protein I
MGERDPLESLRHLEKGLDRARQNRGDGARAPRRGGFAPGSQSALGLAFRISLELVVAVVIGVGIGWALDRWLGTAPWGMIILFFLGVAAGMVNVYRAISGMGMAVGYRRRAPPPAQSVGFDEDDEDGK